MPIVRYDQRRFQHAIQHVQHEVKRPAKPRVALVGFKVRHRAPPNFPSFTVSALTPRLLVFVAREIGWSRARVCGGRGWNSQGPSYRLAVMVA